MLADHRGQGPAILPVTAPCSSEGLCCKCLRCHPFGRDLERGQCQITDLTHYFKECNLALDLQIFQHKDS